MLDSYTADKVTEARLKYNGLTVTDVNMFDLKDMQRLVKIDNLWPTKDRQKALESEDAYFVQSMRDALRDRPIINKEDSPEKQRLAFINYVAFVKDVQDWGKQIMNGEKRREPVENWLVYNQIVEHKDWHSMKYTNQILEETSPITTKFYNLPYSTQELKKEMAETKKQEEETIKKDNYESLNKYAEDQLLSGHITKKDIEDDFHIHIDNTSMSQQQIDNTYVALRNISSKLDIDDSDFSQLNQRELENIASNNSQDITKETMLRVYKKTYKNASDKQKHELNYMTAKAKKLDMFKDLPKDQVIPRAIEYFVCDRQIHESASQPQIIDEKIEKLVRLTQPDQREEITTVVRDYISFCKEEGLMHDRKLDSEKATPMNLNDGFIENGVKEVVKGIKSGKINLSNQINQKIDSKTKIKKVETTKEVSRTTSTMHM